MSFWSTQERINLWTIISFNCLKKYWFLSGPQNRNMQAEARDLFYSSHPVCKIETTFCNVFCFVAISDQSTTPRSVKQEWYRLITRPLFLSLYKRKKRFGNARLTWGCSLRLILVMVFVLSRNVFGIMSPKDIWLPVCHNHDNKLSKIFNHWPDWISHTPLC